MKILVGPGVKIQQKLQEIQVNNKPAQKLLLIFSKKFY